MQMAHEIDCEIAPDGQRDIKQRNRAARRQRKALSTSHNGHLDRTNFEEDYSMLADELKQLYVAVTRSRHRVIIFDEDREKRAPFYLMCQLNGVTRSNSEFGNIQTNNSSSSISPLPSNQLTNAEELKNKAAEWETQGKALIISGFYERAALCFKMAGNVNECRNATARHLIEIAKQATTSNEKSSALFAAGFEFLMTTQSDNLQAAQECFKQAGYREIARHSYFDSVVRKEEGGGGGGGGGGGAKIVVKKVAKKKKNHPAVNYSEDY